MDKQPVEELRALVDEARTLTRVMTATLASCEAWTKAASETLELLEFQQRAEREVLDDIAWQQALATLLAREPSGPIQ